MSTIVCQICGEINSSDITLYDINLRKQDIDISPIHPTCNFCKSSVKITTKCSGGEIIILNGTCGSGKSTIAGELMKRFGYYAIDGDCVNQSVKYKFGLDDLNLRAKVEFNSDETLSEIADEIDYISLFSDKIVLSHIILPEDMDRYIKIFNERNLDYHFFLLKPSYEEAVARCQVRTCHKTVTPENYIRYYYDKLVLSDGVTVIDSSNLSVDDTICQILDFKINTIEGGK